VEVAIREALPDESPALVRLMHAAFEEYSGVLDPPSAAHTETLESVNRRLSRGGAVLALLNDEPVGFVFYEPQGTHLYFSRLSVLPAFRRRGIGRALIEHVESRARETGFAGVRLGVRAQLPQMQARYERLGYQVTKYMTHEGYEKPTYMFMEKAVAVSR
jgi:ribosomal protein S18 acetylase RimI-like enzyme